MTEVQYQKILIPTLRDHRPLFVQYTQFMGPLNPPKVSYHHFSPNRDDHSQIYMIAQS